MTPALMIQGTGSDVGKTLLVAGLARAFARRGIQIQPFKPQNMSNNAAVTIDGGEIGRAQAMQARACRVAPSVHMNPILLKPQSDLTSQVIVQGQVVGTFTASEYQTLKPTLADAVRDSYRRLSSNAQLVIVEGAGSPAEVNLRANDIANMGFAVEFNIPVVLVGDIDRGGVIASLVGTSNVLSLKDRAMIHGFIINKFRGDESLFDEGLKIIETHTGWRSVGIVPFIRGLALPAEDAIEIKEKAGGITRVEIAVLLFPHIANSDDFDPLQLEPSVNLVFVRPGSPVPATADIVILPGSKATISDLRFLKKQGWDIDVYSHVRRGGRVLGLCGGYQMLGAFVADPFGIEGPPTSEKGLCLLDVETVLEGPKTLARVSGTLANGNVPFSGYEIHMGRTTGAGTSRPLLLLANGSPDGAISTDGRIAGCYVHGLFVDDAQRNSWLSTISATATISYEHTVEESLEKLANTIEERLDLEFLMRLSARARG